MSLLSYSCRRALFCNRHFLTNIISSFVDFDLSSKFISQKEGHKQSNIWPYSNFKVPRVTFYLSIYLYLCFGSLQGAGCGVRGAQPQCLNLENRREA